MVSATHGYRGNSQRQRCGSLRIGVRVDLLQGHDVIHCLLHPVRMHAERRLQQLHRKNQNIASEHGSHAQHEQESSLTWFLEKRRDDSGRQELVRWLRRSEQRRAEALLPTYFQGPAGSMFVVVADALQLTASGELPDDELEAAPQTLAVEEDEELGHHPGGGGGEDRDC